MASNTENLVGLFGSKQRLATAAGCSAALVTRWLRKGVVPSRYNHAILSAAGKAALDVQLVGGLLSAHVCPRCGAPLEPGGDGATVTG